MFIFKHGSQRVAQVLRASHSPCSKRFASRIAIPFTPPPFPVIDSCPAPTCQCRESPPDLDIEREQSLNGSMAAYAEQVLISTGRTDWKSKIEDDEEAVLVRKMKKLLLRGGKYVDPYHNVLVSNSSLAPSEDSSNRQPPVSPKTPSPANTKSAKDDLPESGPPASAFLLPSFQYIPSIPTDTASVEAFIKAWILPEKLHHSYEKLSREQQNILLRQPELQRQFVGARKVDEILILICGHGGRDDRCGKMAPVLIAEFEEKLQRQNIAILKDPPVADAIEVNTEVEGYVPTARIASISHIGGHKYAGNVIIYIPPSFTSNPLAGKGIWYGRVGPEHVEGIVAKTVLEGKVIKDHFRGGIDQSREILRL